MSAALLALIQIDTAIQGVYQIYRLQLYRDFPPGLLRSVDRVGQAAVEFSPFRLRVVLSRVDPCHGGRLEGLCDVIEISRIWTLEYLILLILEEGRCFFDRILTFGDFFISQVHSRLDRW